MVHYIKKDIHYFLKPGKENTEKAIELARKRAKEIGIRHIVVASFSGETGLKVMKEIKDAEIVVVGAYTGFRVGKAGEEAEVIWRKNSESLVQSGARILRATHSLSGIERSVASKYNGVYPALLIADTLRLLSQGVKVGVEVAVMAADAGLIPTDQDVITICGTKNGADTVMVLRPANMANLFDIKIKEIVCKPKE